MKKGFIYNKLTFLLIFLSAYQYSSASNENSIFNANFSVDFMSMHTWRGYATSDMPTVEPSLELSTANSKVGIWAAHSIDGKYSEIDLYFSYQYKNITFSVFDYYCPPSYKETDEITNYTRYSTKHTIELALEYNNMFKSPFNFMVASMVYGDDLNSETKENRYSTYFQFSYSTTIEKNSIDLVLGFNAFDNTYYADSFGIVNAGITTTRNLKAFKSKEIPLQASLITNPTMNSLFLKFGFTL